MNHTERIRLLRKVELFQDVTESILGKIADDVEFQHYSTGEFLVRKGEIGDALMIILKGRVHVTDQGHLFSELGPEEVIGEYYLIDSQEHSADVIARTDVQIIRVSQDTFQKVTTDFTSVDTGVMKFLVGRLRKMNIIEEDLARKKKEIEKQKTELEKLNATKDKFFSIIGHDLRSPTSTMITLSEMLISDLESFDHDTIRELLDDVNKVAHNNLELLNSLLEWARSQQGRMPFEPRELNVRYLAEEICLEFRAMAVKKGVEIRNALQKDYPAYGDANMLSLVLRNLLTNAIKYTSNGGLIELSAKMEGDMLQIAVKDNGTGISEQNIKKLFRLDCHFTTTGTANELGTGLGLILCKEFVVKNGGSLKVDSRKGKGSTFYFTVPTKRQQA